MNTKQLIALLAAMATFAMTPVADACTGITLKAKDGAVVFGRTMEWGTFDLLSQVVIVPRGQQFTGHTPDRKPGLTWKGQHGFVGLILFLGMGISVWRCAGRVIRSSDRSTGQGTRDVMLGQMTKASIVAFAVGGAFLPDSQPAMPKSRPTQDAPRSAAEASKDQIERIE
mgnify:CR=1 FL=1